MVVRIRAKPQSGETVRPHSEYQHVRCVMLPVVCAMASNTVPVVLSCSPTSYTPMSMSMCTVYSTVTNWSMSNWWRHVTWRLAPDAPEMGACLTGWVGHVSPRAVVSPLRRASGAHRQVTGLCPN